METFVLNDEDNYYSMITSITINGKNTYEQKGKFLDDLHNNAFSGTNGKDADLANPRFEGWLATKLLTSKTMDIFTKGALWDYWKMGGDEIEEPTPVKHTCKPFNYKTRFSEWPTCSSREDGYCNGGNFPGAYHIGNSLHYQDLEWYEALKDSELNDEALRNRAIMESLISNESSNDCWKRWRSHEITYHNHDEIKYENETHNEKQELREAHELPVSNIRKFKMIKYSFGQDEEYVAIKKDEYDDLARTSNDACQTYQEIFRMMDEGWMVTRAE
uniref:Uncharacterized protein n=1 Tax=Tanacetum cinerariifolium TaxID=118510 RepID=A0A699GW99_TANCI|nr:hypothetical protein [Tanacetum cinerariifolium]